MRKALIVGVASYDEAKSELKTLRTPVRDAHAMREILASEAHGRYDACMLADPTCDEMRRKVEGFLTSAGQDDELLLYFSGHGRLSQDGGLLICARDTEGPKVTSSALKATDVAEWTQRCSCRTLVMIFDCCFSGHAFGDGMKSGPQDEPVRSIVSATLLPGRGKYILTSSGQFQTSMELPDDSNSLFTKWLVRGLQGAADLNREGRVSIDELYDFVHRNVVNERSEQTPRYIARADTPGEIVISLAPNNVKREKPAPCAPLTGSERILSRHWTDGKLIPFLGHAIYGDSALGENALVTALQLDNVRGAISPIATIAEQFLLERNRDDLVDYLSIELEDGENDATETVGNKLLEEIATNTKLNLVVVATYDHLLERALDRAGRSYVQLTHILDSGPEWHQSVGKIAVIQDGACEITSADEAAIPRDRLVVYRPLGSPHLNRVLSEKLDRPTDTMVITETDHLRFGRIYSHEAGFPTALSTRTQDRRLLFLGYALDVWHYRFVLRMLAKQPTNNCEPWAIRQATDNIERKCWDKLGAKVLDVDLTTLLARVLTKQEHRHAA